MTSPNFLPFESFLLVSDVGSYTNLTGVIFVQETNTLYRYEELGSAYTVDDKCILSTSLGGDTRWLAIGQYSVTNNGTCEKLFAGGVVDTPTVAVDVRGEGNDSRVATISTYLYSDSSSILDAGYVLAGRCRGTYESPDYIQNNDSIGVVGFTTYDGSSVPRVIEALHGIATENHTASNRGCDIRLYNTDTGTGIINEKLRLSGDGHVRIGNPSANYLEITNGDGDVRLRGNATQWEDLRTPVTMAIRGGANDPDLEVYKTNGSGSRGVVLYFFSDTREEELFFQMQLPHNWLQGSEIRPHVHWIGPSGGGAGERVRWGLEYHWESLGEVFGNTSIVYGTANYLDEDIVADKHYLTNITPIDGTGQTISSMLNCRVFRDATNAGDDYGDDVGLMEIDFHYQVNSFGSDEEYIKS